jgi:DNA-binding LytR/AlgR family response regulator
MTEQAITILIVEDDLVIAANISLQLSKLGYEVAAIIPKGEEALRFLKENEPDLILLDINLRDETDGIAVAQAVKAQADTPIIFLTSNTDEATFARAKATQPHAFISKPFKKLDLQRAIELAISRMAVIPQAPASTTETAAAESAFILSDRIFVRHKGKLVKLYITDILFAEAERSYCRIFTAYQDYLLTTPLKSLEELLPSEHFLRIHRSYIINIAKIDAIGDQFSYVSIGKQTLRVSEAYQTALAKRLRTI